MCYNLVYSDWCLDSSVSVKLIRVSILVSSPGFEGRVSCGLDLSLLIISEYLPKSTGCKMLLQKSACRNSVGSSSLSSVGTALMTEWASYVTTIQHNGQCDTVKYFKPDLNWNLKLIKSYCNTVNW